LGRSRGNKLRKRTNNRIFKQYQAVSILNLRFLFSRLVWLFLFFLGIYLVPKNSYAQDSLISTPTDTVSQPNKKEKRLLKRVQKKKKKKEQKLYNEILNTKADSLKIAAILQLKNNPESKQIDSLKRVQRNPRKFARQELGKSDQFKDAKKELTPQIDIYEDNKDLLMADSATLEQEIRNTTIKELNKTQEAKDIKEDIAPYIDSPFLKGIELQDLDSMSTEDLDTLRSRVFKNLEDHYVAEMFKREELISTKKEMAELEALKGLPESYRKQFEAYKNGESLKKEALSKAAAEAQKILAKHTPELNKGQADLSKLKSTYSSVPSSDDLSTATRRNSLKGKSFKSRIVIGGTFQVVTTNPVTIDISPILGYRFNKDFHVAIGVTYRARFTSADSTYIRTNYGRDELTYGYRAFANYTFWKAFFLHGEYERMNKEFVITGTDNFERRWKPGLLAGIGSTYTIKGKLKGNVSILYNFLHDNRQRIYQSPWVFRFGMNLNLSEK